LAEEARQYQIPDFSNWKNHDAFERAFAPPARCFGAIPQKIAFHAPGFARRCAGGVRPDIKYQT
jgi:hypothetical protein